MPQSASLPDIVWLNLSFLSILYGESLQPHVLTYYSKNVGQVRTRNGDTECGEDEDKFKAVSRYTQTEIVSDNSIHVT